MNRDNLEGGFRSAVGQGEKIVGQAMGDKATAAQGSYDDAAGKARSAVGNAKDAISAGVDAVSAVDFSALRDEITKLTQMVSDLAQKQVSAGRDQVVSAMGKAAAGDGLSQSVWQWRRTDLSRLRATSRPGSSRILGARLRSQGSSGC